MSRRTSQAKCSEEVGEGFKKTVIEYEDGHNEQQIQILGTSEDIEMSRPISNPNNFLNSSLDDCEIFVTKQDNYYELSEDSKDFQRADEYLETYGSYFEDINFGTEEEPNVALVLKFVNNLTIDQFQQKAKEYDAIIMETSQPDEDKSKGSAFDQWVQDYELLQKIKNKP